MDSEAWRIKSAQLLSEGHAWRKAHSKATGGESEDEGHRRLRLWDAYLRRMEPVPPAGFRTRREASGRALCKAMGENMSPEPEPLERVRRAESAFSPRMKNGRSVPARWPLDNRDPPCHEDVGCRFARRARSLNIFWESLSARRQPFSP